MEKIVYIAGYGRSGSTVLDILLGSHPDIVSVGEASFLLEDWQDPDRLCACGSPYPECSFWRDFVQRGREMGLFEKNELLRRLEKSTSVPRLLLGRVSAAEKAAYRAYQDHLLHSVAAASGRQIIVDSSKSARDTAGRFLALDRLAGQDVYVIHLVRSGLATLESLLFTGSNWALEGRIEPPRWMGLRAVIGWLNANLLAQFLGHRLGPGRYLRLRYEDLVAEPEALLRTVAEFLQLDFRPVIARIEQDRPLPIGHLTGGNRLRMQTELRLQRKRPHAAGRRLPRRQRLLFWLLAGWLQLYYGYA